MIASVFEAHAGLYDEGDLTPEEHERIDLAQSRLAWLAEVTERPAQARSGGPQGSDAIRAAGCGGEAE